MKYLVIFGLLGTLSIVTYAHRDSLPLPYAEYSADVLFMLFAFCSVTAGLGLAYEFLRDNGDNIIEFVDKWRDPELATYEYIARVDKDKLEVYYGSQVQHIIDVDSAEETWISKGRTITEHMMRLYLQRHLALEDCLPLNRLSNNSTQQNDERAIIHILQAYKYVEKRPGEVFRFLVPASEILERFGL